MLEGKALEKAVSAIMARLGIVNTLYIKKIAEQIKRIGKMAPSSVSRLVAMAEMNADIGQIEDQLRTAIGANNVQLKALFELAVEEGYKDPRFRVYLEKNPDALRPEAKERVERFAETVYRQTG